MSERMLTSINQIIERKFQGIKKLRWVNAAGRLPRQWQRPHQGAELAVLHLGRGSDEQRQIGELTRRHTRQRGLQLVRYGIIQHNRGGSDKPPIGENEILASS